MNFKSLLDDEDAVSPVIGVILMVAITVILAAVIGTFVLGLGDQVQTTTPSHNFDTEASGSDVTFASTGGQSVDAGNLVFRSDISDLKWVNDTGTENEVNGNVTWATAGEMDAGSSVSAGDSVEFTNGSDWTGGETITLVWEDQGQSSTMTTWEAQ